MRYVKVVCGYIKQNRNDTSNKNVCLSVNNKLRKNTACVKELNAENFKTKHGNRFVLKDSKLTFT